MWCEKTISIVAILVSGAVSAANIVNYRLANAILYYFLPLMYQLLNYDYPFCPLSSYSRNYFQAFGLRK